MRRMFQVVAKIVKPIVRPLIERWHLRPLVDKWRHSRAKIETKLKFTWLYLFNFPPLTAIRLILLKRKLWKSRTGELVGFPISDRVRVALRSKTTDIRVFEQIFVFGDCRVKLQSEPHFIVDAGAHIGCSALFFASSFPRANVTAIEPAVLPPLLPWRDHKLPSN